MTNKPTVHVNSCAWEAYADRFYNEMKFMQTEIFQARKIGITIQIPENARELIKTRYGTDGVQFLDMVDGKSGMLLSRTEPRHVAKAA